MNYPLSIFEMSGYIATEYETFEYSQIKQAAIFEKEIDGFDSHGRKIKIKFYLTPYCDEITSLIELRDRDREIEEYEIKLKEHKFLCNKLRILL